MNPAGGFCRKIAYCSSASVPPGHSLIEKRVTAKAEKMVLFMEIQDGKPFDPADCLLRSVANVICGMTFKEGSGTSNPDINKTLWSVHFDVMVVELTDCKCGGIVRNGLW